MPLQLQRSLRTAVEAARSIDIRPWEERDPVALVEGLVPVVARALGTGIEAFGHVLGHYEAAVPQPGSPEAGEEPDFYRGIDALMVSSTAGQRIADLSFMARWELARKCDALAGLGRGEGSWKIVSECGSGRRRLLKSATAVERALCEHEALSPSLEGVYVSEIELSLQVRKAYQRFRQGIVPPPPEPEAAVIHARLRGAAVAIAVLIGRDVYEDLRVSDRIQLRALQARIIGWLREPAVAGARAGLRLWQDLAAFAELLGGVNSRAELREHDLRTAEAALSALRPGATPPLFVAGPDDVRRLLGRDAELDELLAQGAAGSPERWHEALARVVKELGARRAEPSGQISERNDNPEFI